MRVKNISEVASIGDEQIIKSKNRAYEKRQDSIAKIAQEIMEQYEEVFKKLAKM